MPDYAKTIIYKIQHEDDESLVYVGNTTDFTKRKCHHKERCCSLSSSKRHYKIYKMMRDNGGWGAFRMVQIKEFPCENRRQAEAEEDKIMLELKANMNDRRAYRTKEQYRLDNVENKREYDMEYRKKNKEKLIRTKKQYYEKNKEQLSQRHKEYYQKNKEAILQQMVQKVTCECGCEVSKQSLSHHKKTIKHAKLLNDALKQ